MHTQPVKSSRFMRQPAIRISAPTLNKQTLDPQYQEERPGIVLLTFTAGLAMLVLTANAQAIGHHLLSLF
jgi:hypothetical protein